MTGVAIGLAMVGATAAVVGWIWLLVIAFKESPAWGVGLILAPGIVGWIFTGLHLEEAAVPFVVHFFGSVLLVLAIFFGTPSIDFGIFWDSGLPGLERQLEGDSSLPLLIRDTGMPAPTFDPG